MLDNELVDMVKQIQLVRSESNKIEIKAANKGCPKVRDSLSSFSNQSGGGVIIFGVDENDGYEDRKSTRLNSSHTQKSRMPSSA